MASIDQKRWLLEHRDELGLTEEQIQNMELDDLDYYCNDEPPWFPGPPA